MKYTSHVRLPSITGRRLRLTARTSQEPSAVADRAMQECNNLKNKY